MSQSSPQEENKNSTITSETVNFHLEEGMSIDLLSKRMGLVTTGQPTNIKDFLSRPVNFSSYTWTTAQSPGTDIFNINLLNTITAISMYTNKLQGFRNWKFTVCVKVVLAPSPFHAGAVRLSWLPWTANTKADRGNMHKGLIPNSQLPGVMLTCEENSVEMKVPYIGPVLGYDKANTDTSWSWGNLRLAVYSSLATGTGANSVAVDGYIWLEDIELGGVTAQGRFSTAVRSKSRQMVVTDKEIADGKGPISRVLGSTAILANRLGDFPILTPFFKPAAWVLNALKGSAEAFGYSKPTTGEGTKYTMVVRNADAYAPNVNGKDNATTLTLLGDAKNTMHQMLQTTDFDESSIDFIKRHWSYFESFSISTSNSPNDILYSKLIAPRGFGKVYTVPASASSNYSVFWLTPVNYLGEVFESYRGDFEIRLVFVKTGFHACQVEIAFSMDQVATPNTQFYLREIVDIQAGNEFCFTIPYTRVEPFIPTWDNIGLMQVSLVNNLQAPTTVKNSIEVMVFVRGASNLTYTRPSTSFPTPVMGPQGAYDDASNDAICKEPQPIGNSTSNSPVMLSQYTAGEQVMSLRQLANRYSRMGIEVGNAITRCFDPFYMGRSYFTFSTYYGYSLDPMAQDAISRFSGLFLFYSGSIKIKFKNLKPGTLAYKAFVFPYNNIGDLGPRIYSVITPDMSYSDYYMDSNQISNGVRIPQYSKYLGYPRNNFSSQATSDNPYLGQVSLLLQASDETSISLNTLATYRAAGEDFQYQFFLGIPTVLLGYVPF